MVSFLEGLQSAGQSAFCTLLRNNIKYLNNVNNSTFPIPSPGGLAEETHRFLYRKVCNLEPPELPGPGFQGGQCDVQYLVVVRQVEVGNNFAVDPPSCDRLPPAFPQGVVWGPIGGLRQRGAKKSGASGSPCEDTTSYQFVDLWCRGVGGSPEAAGWYPFIINGNTVSASIESIARLDGQPDNCGNLPEPPQPYNPPDLKFPFKFTYETNDGLDVDVSGNFIFAIPIVNVKGELEINFRLELAPDITFNGQINNNGDFEFYIGGGGSGPDNPPKSDPRKDGCDKGAEPEEEPPPVPPDTPEPEEPEEDPAEEQIIVGALVTVTSIDFTRSTVIGQGENPDIYAPNLGFINFWVRVGETAAGWTADIPIKNRRQFVPSPYPEGTIGVEGTPQTGVNWVITPIRVAKQPVQYQPQA